MAYLDLPPAALLNISRINFKRAISLGEAGVEEPFPFFILNSGWSSKSTRNTEKQVKQRCLHLAAGWDLAASDGKDTHSFLTNLP
jgi:hypothetical protein